MTLNEVLNMDTVAFQKACKAAGVGNDDLEHINEDNKTFDTYNSNLESILTIHEAGRAYP